GGANTGGAATGGVGGAATGGAGGAVAVSAGTFNMSNAMSSVGQSAAGIMVASQNSGMSSLIQQSVNVQSNLSLGR
ncbi:hypothetical protein GM676_24260, partial [Duganella radicis]|nr:hypothetical protein [Duganella radicis]